MEYLGLYMHIYIAIRKSSSYPVWVRRGLFHGVGFASSERVIVTDGLFEWSLSCFFPSLHLHPSLWLYWAKVCLHSCNKQIFLEL